MKKAEVIFISEKLESTFESLREEDFIKKFIKRAIEDLKKDPICGTKIKRKLWPKLYIQNYKITNLWKYDLPNSWRLIYTIVGEDEVKILTAILEWFNHKDYERRFSYCFI